MVTYRERAEGAGIVLPGKEMVQGDILGVCDYMMVESKGRAMFLSGA